MEELQELLLTEGRETLPQNPQHTVRGQRPEHAVGRLLHHFGVQPRRVVCAVWRRRGRHHTLVQGGREGGGEGLREGGRSCVGGWEGRERAEAEDCSGQEARSFVSYLFVFCTGISSPFCRCSLSCPSSSSRVNVFLRVKVYSIKPTIEVGNCLQPS